MDPFHRTSPLLNAHCHCSWNLHTSGWFPASEVGARVQLQNKMLHGEAVPYFLRSHIN